MENLINIPILGGILLEAIVEDLQAHIAEKRGLAKDSELAKLGFTVEYAEVTTKEEQAVTGRMYKNRSGNVPAQKGIVLRKATDAYGECFKAKYGDDCEIPEIGDTVMFIPGQAFKVDFDGKYLIIKDEDVMLIQRSSLPNTQRQEA